MNFPDLSHWQLHLTETKEWAWYSEVFTPQELDQITALGQSQDFVEGNIFDRDETMLPNLRKSQISWITPTTPNAEWLFRRLTDIVLQVNVDCFDFDLAEIEHLQYTLYDRENDHYDWHRDMLPQMAGRNVRKLSFSLLLDEADNYQGGDLELKFGPNPGVAPKDRGTLIFFPAYVLHRVTPVTQGCRRSLVGWVKGPRWK